VKEYRTIIIEQDKSIVTIWLNRPEKHNALNPDLMNEVIHFLEKIENDLSIRFVIFRGKGISFCAGADLNWMKDAATLNGKENLADSELLTDFFSRIYNSSKITIVIAHGNIFGGGNGIIAACDISYGVANARFSLSETRLGLVAATITPYMVKKLQPNIYKELIFTAKIFNGREAQEFGLLNKSFTLFDAMEEYLEKSLNAMKNAGPNSLIGSKKLINDLADPLKVNEIIKNIPQLLANVRVTNEAKEGFAAFIEKRKPKWID
jgi:methylglutaconyl-CoA hydratase